jgi:replicative DNA helicase
VSERVVELPTQASRPAPEFERTPPQDIAAEQSVLGGMLLSKDAIADVVEVVRATDFYRPAHQTIFDVVVDLYGRGEPADPITVSAELTRLGEIGRVGGAPYLHTLLSSVPTAANAGFYAKIVAEQAVLRRLVEAGTRIVQLGYGAAGTGGVDDVVDRAQQSIYDVTERRSSEDYTLLEELMQPTMDELEAIGSRGGSMSGVPTGFADLDGLTNGLHAGQLIVIAGRPGLGKALALDTPLPTPTGWTTMGEVAVGDLLLDADGRPTRVVAATPVLQDRPCYEVAFSDGTRVVADAEHQWLTETRASRRSPVGAAQVRTTQELAATVRCPGRDGRANHSVRTTRALQLPDAELELDPYALGVWLAAGPRRSADAAEIGLRLEAGAGPRSAHPAPPTRPPRSDEAATPPLRHVVEQWAGHDGAALPAPDLTGVPGAYLRAGEQQRRALLAGLMDAAGAVSTTGNLQLTTTSAQLAEDLQELVVGLGHRCTVTPRRDAAAPGERRTVTWTCDERVFAVERKHLLHKTRSRTSGSRTAQRWVVAVTPVPSVPVRCVEVDNPDHLYLATRAMVPHPQLDARAGHRPGGLGEARHAERDLLAGDEQDRDHHAPALRRGQGAAAPHALGDDDRRRLGPPGPSDGRGGGGAALHRRLPEPHHDGDPGQGAPPAPAQRPAAHRHRLPPADERQQEGGEPAAGGLRAVPVAEAAGQGAGDPGDRHEPAQPRCRGAYGQEAADQRPARVRLHRAGR